MRVIQHCTITATRDRERDVLFTEGWDGESSEEEDGFHEQEVNSVGNRKWEEDHK